MYRDRLKPKPAFIDYASAAAWLTSMGSSFRGVAEVINRSSAAVVGRWAWVDGAIRPIGPIDFTAVTATQGATIGSVTGNVLDLGSSTFVVTGGYVLRIWNTTDGSLVADVAAGSWTRSGAGIDAGAAVAATVAALIAGGKSIRCWVEGLSELSIGGATSAIELGAGSASAFNSGLVQSGISILRCHRPYGPALLRATLSSYELSAAGDFVGVGWALSGVAYSIGGIGRNGATDYPAYRINGVNSYGPLSVSGAQGAVQSSHVIERSDGNATWAGSSTLVAGATAALFPISSAGYAASAPALYSTKTSTVTRIEL